MLDSCMIPPDIELWQLSIPIYISPSVDLMIGLCFKTIYHTRDMKSDIPALFHSLVQRITIYYGLSDVFQVERSRPSKFQIETNRPPAWYWNR